MIDHDEIVHRAGEFGIHASNVERDYVFGWILVGIYGDSPLGKQLVFKGGNCLRKAYFEHTRFSADLDFSVQSQINQEQFLAEINRVCDFVHAQTGVTFDKDRNRLEQKFFLDKVRSVYHARLYFRDFSGNADHLTISVRLDLTEMDRLYLPVQERNLIHPYSDSSGASVTLRCMKLEEILGSKLKCLLQRRQTQDLYDFLFSFAFNRELAINRREVVVTFLKKTIFEPSPGAAKVLLLELPFEALRRVWTKYIICPRQSWLDFDVALEQFRTILDAVFQEVPAGTTGWVSFFPSHLRNPIIEAGKDQKLLALTYHGTRREVEPYSLVFKRRKDGVGQEYFYAYDLTGGNSNPGIKAFLAPDIHDLTILERTFEPRYEVELSKAGEPSDRGYFSREFGGVRTTPIRRTLVRRQLHRGRLGLRFVFECPVCQKHFTRSTNNSLLNSHKDNYGNPCFGRMGYLVEQKM